LGAGFVATRCVVGRRSLDDVGWPDVLGRRLGCDAVVESASDAGVGPVVVAGAARVGARFGACFGADRHADKSNTLAKTTSP
jgi:hypothetical protein